MPALPMIDARFLYLGEPAALVKYTQEMAQLIRFWESQTLIRVHRRCQVETLSEDEARAEDEIVQHAATRFESFLGSHVVLHSWALLEGLIKWASDFVASQKGLLDRDGNGPRLSGRDSWPKEFRTNLERDPVTRWEKWFQTVLSYAIPLSAEQISKARQLSRIRNSIGHELMDEPSAREARLDRIKVALSLGQEEVLSQIDPVHYFGSPPGIDWAECVAEIAETIVAALKKDFPSESAGHQFWHRPSLGAP